MALLGLAACDKPAAPDPVDQARAALQDRFGADYELHAAIVEKGSAHTIVCGRAGKPAQGDVPFVSDSDFLVVDGKLIEGESPSGVASMAIACRTKLPEGIPAVPIS
jgi:hypothetical protein